MALLGLFVKMFFTQGALQPNGLLSESRILIFGIIPCADAALLTLARLLWKYAANVKAQLLTPQIRERVDELPPNSAAEWENWCRGDEALIAKTSDFQRN